MVLNLNMKYEDLCQEASCLLSPAHRPATRCPAQPQGQGAGWFFPKLLKCGPAGYVGHNKKAPPVLLLCEGTAAVGWVLLFELFSVDPAGV